MEQHYILEAIDAALLAGREILAVYNDPSSDFGIERKADNSPLTLADKRAHEIIRKRLEQTPFPMLSEEGISVPYAERCGWETFWMVDPLDGTKEFIKRNGEFTVNIALIVGTKPVMGVVYVPVTKELYWGVEGDGAYRLAGITDGDGRTLEALKADAVRLPEVEERYGFFPILLHTDLTYNHFQ